MNKHLLPLLLWVVVPATGLAQGSLAPPGQPAPTMKRLDEVEARIIVNAANTPGDDTNTFIIANPGSYYLTGNITGASGKHGISIRADDVTLDLNGFVLSSGGGATARGIDVPAEHKNLTLRNGTVRGWSGGGVRAELMGEVLAEKLRLLNNAGAVGLSVGLGSLVKDCVARGNGVGFQTADRCQVNNCISTENSSHGFQLGAYVTILDCTSSRNGGRGIDAQGNATVMRCSASRNETSGIVVGSGSTMSNCTAASNTGDGILADTFSTVTNCTATDNTFFGIYVHDGVIAFCTAKGNNPAGNPIPQIASSECTTTGNNPP